MQRRPHDPVGLQAATQGLAIAQYRLGVRYEKGEGVAADAAKERRPITALRTRTCACDCCCRCAALCAAVAAALQRAPLALACLALSRATRRRQGKASGVRVVLGKARRLCAAVSHVMPVGAKAVFL